MADLEILKGFIIESLDLLDSLEPKLIELQSACEATGEIDGELINSIFRPFHSMKGSAGMLELNNITALTHTAETLLDMFRNGQLLVRPSHTALLFDAMDLVRQMLSIADETQNDAGLEGPVKALVAQLSAVIAGADVETVQPEATAVQLSVEQPVESHAAAVLPGEPPAASPETPAAAPAIEDADNFEIPITAEMVAKFVQEASDLLDQFEQSLLVFEDRSDPEQIIQAFRAIHSFKGNCGFMGYGDLERLSHKMETLLECMKHQSAGSPVEAVTTLLKLVDVLREGMNSVARGKGGAIPGCDIYAELLSDLLAEWDRKAPKTEAKQQQPVLAAESAAPAAPAPVNGAAGQPAAVMAPVPPPSGPPSGTKSVVRQDIRVDLRKLDSLLNLVGELVIAEAMMTRNPLIAQHEDEGVERAVHQLRRVSRELQDVAMSVRMIPLASTFQRMIRLVHDLSHKSGKKVNLQLVGEETEVDKTVIEQIGDPIVHLVRNALDHGIETPEERRAAGKPETATLTIEGRHEGGEVWITIRDDGRGLNRDKILAKAVERGLVREGTELSDKQIYKLIFEPGFSTADKVTDISGRGVGMDVVKKNIEKIKGRVDIQSTPGRGAVFILRIPLTLAIIEGMLVRVGDSRYIIPLLNIRESVHPEADQITVTPDGMEVIRVREEFFLVVRIHQLFNKEPENRELHDGIIILVEVEGQTVALFVDEILGQQETVIKGLSDYVARARCVSGCTILGDGEVSLILDVGAIAGSVSHQLGAAM